MAQLSVSVLYQFHYFHQGGYVFIGISFFVSICLFISNFCVIILDQFFHKIYGQTAHGSPKKPIDFGANPIIYVRVTLCYVRVRVGLWLQFAGGRAVPSYTVLPRPCLTVTSLCRISGLDALLNAILVV